VCIRVNLWLISCDAKPREQKHMSKDKTKINKGEMRPEYDLSKLTGKTRGKYVDRYRKGTNLVLLESDVQAAFPDSVAVNEALRMLMKIARKQVSERSNTLL
jgi:hypothetical protein